MRSFNALPTSLLVLVSSAITSAQKVEKLPDGLIIEHTSGPVVCDRPTRSHDKIAVHYKGTLQSDGSEFDESYKRGKPFEFTLDGHEVIKGWDEGLMGMCIGQSRKLTIPPELGYGDYGAGPIPPKATLIFETKLIDIVELSDSPPGPSETQDGALSIATAPPIPLGDEDIEDIEDQLLDDGDVEDAIQDKEGLDAEPTTSDDAPTDGPPQRAQCHLLGPFALLVQGALGALALLTLVWKRWREVPKRPWKIFFYDVSKQVFGSMLTHVINLAMSMLGSVDMANAAAHVASNGSSDDSSGRSPNPCSFYLLNLGIDTTIGVPVLWFLLKILYHLFLRTPLANPPESIKSGNYGSPAKGTWYLKQLLIYCIGLVFMKLFVFFLFLAMPWLPWIGDWALRWTEGNEALQVTFALFVFPLAMNAIQYWVIDNFIMDKKKGEGKGYEQVAGQEEDEEARINFEDDSEVTEVDGGHGKLSDESEDNTAQKMKEVDPVPIPSYPARKNGESSGKPSPKND
ncbi:hypothetical protein M409DRAFT_70327 [Zasmidium cellare ATCC 36951]|uniref:peptidylprolyl isomerase n=1 Tax=Zasmidium cellare ATCC 36951 TaxID=1080233 RepID=A0A6A6C0J8_ZASCE|nr:uncharacterized protein M409DRAFT_70327 [Zasmidium cellare ATCC 36951]KAF2160577.1 hypothetical protein M409DRAFT_70327 [Zasmidium cellare ATCC 36951]